MRFNMRRVRKPLLFAAHVLLIPLAYFAGFALRFDIPVPSRWMDLFWATAPVLLALRLAAFSYFRLYEGSWRHAGMQDLMDLLKAVSVSSMGLLVVLFMVGEFRELPRSLLVLDWLIAMGMFGGVRFAVRSAREQRMWRRRAERGRRALIIGAGDAAEALLRQFRRYDSNQIQPILLVDDDPAKLGMQLHGVRVEGTTDDLPRLCEAHHIELLVIALPSADRRQMQRIVERCAETEIEFKVVPSLEELVDGRARLSQLRSVDIEDLLGRSTVRLSLDAVESNLADRVVMITGGAGSIGSELLRQIARFQPRRLLLVDKAESPLYFAHLEICRAYPGLEVVPVIADVTDTARMEQLFALHEPTHLFHAAAYKHVPLMEENAVEAVRNNVFGTLRLAECAARYGVQKFVLISTDKAVRPSSVMGASKRIAERIVLGWPTLRASGTDFRAVRFGNVLGSDGSVVPLFKRQLAAGQPLTVTHPDVTRYFMTIPEAVQLVLQASVMPEAAGRISMLEMGEPVRIVSLAENLIRLSGLEPYRDVPIVFTGLRPGEKLHEELMSQVEQTVATGIEKIRIVQTDETDRTELERGLDCLAAALTLATREDLLNAIRHLVPECEPPLRKSEWVAPRVTTVPAARPVSPVPAVLVPPLSGRAPTRSPATVTASSQVA
ncbi:MAG TPA: nucleoside-diphosphate sugar epimerase/dehydratase [Longimicrobiales bacterium]|nr:nucleoside-diphosphate sugar epimerase/dehydratase [Longimicrobiales bacterium]